MLQINRHPQTIYDRYEDSPYIDESFRDARHIPDPTPPWEGKLIFKNNEAELQQYILLTGLIKNDEIKILSVLRINTRPDFGGQPLEGVIAEALDNNGEIINRTPLLHMISYACGNHGCSGKESLSGVVQAMLPDVNGVKALCIKHNKEELWMRRTTEKAPQIEDIVARIQNEELYITWHSKIYESDYVERLIRWSANNGTDWTTFAFALQDDAAVVPLTSFPSGDILIEIIVSDGFYTAFGKTIVSVPLRTPAVAILWPAERCTVRAGIALRLWGTATSSDGNSLCNHRLQWEIDGKHVGEGPEHWEELSEWEGEHKVTLKVCDKGYQAETSVIFLATCSGATAIYAKEKL